MIGDQASDFLAVRSGVPQESVQGPLLFSFCTNDFYTEGNAAGVECEVECFADDTVIFACGKP